MNRKSTKPSESVALIPPLVYLHHFSHFSHDPAIKVLNSGTGGSLGSSVEGMVAVRFHNTVLVVKCFEYHS